LYKRGGATIALYIIFGYCVRYPEFNNVGRHCD
ncbi:hypothetical protein AZ005_004573, partial [Escherichia coli]